MGEGKLIGIKQANNVGKKLCKELQGSKFVKYSSDLLREKQTVGIVGKYWTIVSSYQKRNCHLTIVSLLKWQSFLDDFIFGVYSIFINFWKKATRWFIKSFTRLLLTAIS